MEKKQIIVVGDTVLDNNIYQGNRMITDSVNKAGTKIEEELGGAHLLYEFSNQILLQIKSHYQEATDLAKKEIEELQKKIDEKPPSDDKKQADIDSLKKEIFKNNEMIEEKEELIKHLNVVQTTFGINADKQNVPDDLKGYALWDLHLKTHKKDEKEQVWRISKNLGYGSGIRPRKIPFDKISFDDYTTLVLDDANLGYRFSTSSSAWPSFIEEELGKKIPDKLKNVIYKMVGPLCKGDLWRKLTSTVSEKLTTIISIYDIRKEEVKISKGMSWEQTVLELINELHFNENLSPLKKSENLVVTLASEGALVIKNFDKEKEEIELIYDPTCMEGEWDKKNITGKVFGLMSVFTASVSTFSEITSIVNKNEDPLTFGVKMGLQMMRNLKVAGHGIKDSDTPGFQFNVLVPPLDDKSNYRSIIIKPPNKEQNNADWMIISGNPDTETNTKQKAHIPLYGLARQVALNGTAILKSYPHLQVNDLLAIERKEIESLNNIIGLVSDYRDNSKGDSAPLSIGLFGPPGSGKSFTVEELAKEFDLPMLTFNLSQFENVNELTSAFHQVRDVVLKGEIPIVFWDEFDSQKYRWLQFLLAPMQDGEFQEGQLTHPIGRCIFIFAGATSHTYDEFGPKDKDKDTKTKSKDADSGTKDENKEYNDFKLSKGPDFKSRLSGYLDILGPNIRKFNGEIDETDICFPIRRAILIRVMWKYFKNQYLKIDSGLLTAFLEIDEYKFGIRSMKKLISTMRYQNKDQLLQSNLPNKKIVSLYVDYDKFTGKINRDKEFAGISGELAPYIHANYIEQKRNKELAKKITLTPSEVTTIYNELNPDHKESNVAAAKRITRILANIGLKVVNNSETDDILDESIIEKIIETNIELLSEEEHIGWMNSKINEGWQYADIKEQDKSLMLHPLLIQYSELPEEEKDKDRSSVQKFPAILKKAGLFITRIQ